MRNLFLACLFLFGCATTKADVKTVAADIKADISQCKPEEQELVHTGLPLVADYAICLAMNGGKTASCTAQQAALTANVKASAISCGLATIQAADVQATNAAK